MKRIALFLGIAGLLVICFLNIYQMDDNAYTMKKMDEYVSDGAIVDLSDVFSGDWDTVQIMNTPGFSDFDRNEAFEFCEEYGIKLSIVDQFYLLVFRKNNQIVGLIQYHPGSGGPMFVENGKLKEQWILTVPKTDAFFQCKKVSDNAVLFPSAQYTLEHMQQTQDESGY
jgi:hypothetical protein